MAYYHLKLYHRLSNILSIFGEIPVHSYFFDLSEEDIKKIKRAKEVDQIFFVKQKEFHPEKVDLINVYRTSKTTKEYSANSDMQISEVGKGIINGRIGKNVTKLFFPLSVIDEGKTIDDLIVAAKFLGLDENWFISTCALQLREVMIVKLAEKKGISLDKESIKKILNKREVKVSPDYVPFGEIYKAFQKEAKRVWDIKMPELTLEFRNIRSNVLHRGYNPTAEESKSFIEYTAGLLERLKTD